MGALGLGADALFGGLDLAGLFGGAEAVVPEIAAEAAPVFAETDAGLLGAIGGVGSADLGAAGLSDLALGGAGAAGADALAADAGTGALAAEAGGIPLAETDAGLFGAAGGVGSTLGGIDAAGGQLGALGAGGSQFTGALGASSAIPAAGGGVPVSSVIAGDLPGGANDLTAISSGTGGSDFESALAGSQPAGGAPIIDVRGATPQLYGNFAGTGSQDTGGVAQFLSGQGGGTPQFADTEAGLAGAQGGVGSVPSDAGVGVSPGANAAAISNAPAAAGGGSIIPGVKNSTLGWGALAAAPLALTAFRGQPALPPQAGQLNQLASGEQAFAQQQMGLYNANQVLPAQQAGLDAQRQQLTNQYRQMLFQQGVQNPEADSRWPQIQGLIDQQVNQSKSQIMTQNINAAFQGSGQAGNALSNLASMQTQADTAYNQQISQAAESLALTLGLVGAGGHLF